MPAPRPWGGVPRAGMGVRRLAGPWRGVSVPPRPRGVFGPPRPRGVLVPPRPRGVFAPPRPRGVFAPDRCGVPLPPPRPPRGVPLFCSPIHPFNKYPTNTHRRRTINVNIRLTHHPSSEGQLFFNETRSWYVSSSPAAIRRSTTTTTRARLRLSASTAMSASSRGHLIRREEKGRKEGYVTNVVVVISGLKRS